MPRPKARRSRQEPTHRAAEAVGCTFDTARRLAVGLPSVEEGTSYGTAALKVGGKLMARLREDGETLVVRIDPDARDLLLRSDPETFFLTDHYAGHPWVLVRLPRVQPVALATLLEEAFRLVAPPRLLSALRAKPAPRAPAATAKSAPTPTAAKKTRARAQDPLVRLRSICLALPEATEGRNHSAPCFEVRGRTFAMFLDNHHGDGRVAVWCKAPPGAQPEIVAADPRRFFVPPYVGPRGWIGVRLDLDSDWSAIAAVVEDAYRMTAPKRVLAAMDSRRAP